MDTSKAVLTNCLYGLVGIYCGRCYLISKRFITYYIIDLFEILCYPECSAVINALKWPNLISRFHYLLSFYCIIAISNSQFSVQFPSNFFSVVYI